MLTNYAKGRNAEYYIMDMLESQFNCEHIIRSAGSHTPIDIIASNGNHVFAVQVKQGGYISKDDKLELIQWARAFNARAMVAVKEGSRWILKFIGDTH
jgi:Holliday junction resolvase